MATDSGPTGWSATYDRLATAGPAERTALVLNLIRDHGRLELPARDGRPAVLTGVQLGQVDLRHSDLRGAVLRGADLRGATLERADLAGADLAGADLCGAALGEANCRDAMLEDAKFRGAGARFADFTGAALEAADLGDADLWGAVFERAVLTRADLRGATLKEANLRAADLTRADLHGAVLGQSDLAGACLRGVDLQGAELGSSSFAGADLTDTRLERVDLSQCTITGVRLGGARLDRTRLRRDQLGGALGEETAGRFEEARLAYLALERNFGELGDPEAAAWAFGRKRRMEKRLAWERGAAAWAAGSYGSAAAGFGKYASDQAVEWLCDYGESVTRVLLAMFAVILLFTVVYGACDGVVRTTQTPAGPVTEPTRNPVDWVVFSMSAMSPTAKQPAGLLPRTAWVQLMASIQTFLGIALAGLVGFVFGNTARR
ncbi:MAG TPA: pentapeptide repeat-containing protein [Gemmataceae bacterium]|nr:pentapeptide repeat-containing protein [Gemmataceae bacterium]